MARYPIVQSHFWRFVDLSSFVKHIGNQQHACWRRQAASQRRKEVLAIDKVGEDRQGRQNWLYMVCGGLLRRMQLYKK